MNTTLFKQTKSGAIQSWSIELLTHGVYAVTFGQLNGKQQTVNTQCIGKNLGKSNETTPHQQAELEVQSLIAKKLKEGYSYDKSAPITVALPMKVKCYQDQLKNIKFPCYSTPKLNGINGLYRRTDNQLNLYSRGGELYLPIPHLEPLINIVMDELNCNELNGELYISNTPLQDIQSAVAKPNELSSKLTFCIFDLPESTQPYSIRHTVMDEFQNQLKFIGHPVLSHISFITGVICHSHEDIELHYNKCMAMGLEGTVIKNSIGLYEYNTRSSNQFKYKKALDAEFLITSFELDKRKHPVFHLQVPNSELTFKAKPKGTHEFLSSIDPTTYIGKWATVEYETLSKSGVPLKPIFIGLRNCTDAGEPKE